MSELLTSQMPCFFPSDGSHPYEEMRATHRQSDWLTAPNDLLASHDAQE